MGYIPHTHPYWTLLALLDTSLPTHLFWTMFLNQIRLSLRNFFQFSNKMFSNMTH